jgi:hypothetical protein
MTIEEYLSRIKEWLLTDPLVREFEITRERTTVADGYLRARLILKDHSLLEFSEYVQRFARDDIQVVTYSYHWAAADNHLIRRWDNAPHFPDLPGFPHHIHDGRSGEVRSGRPMDIFAVLAQIRIAGSGSTSD